MLLFTNHIIHWLETHLLQCPSKKYLGIDCMGCGMQRSLILLLKGQLINSLKMHPATIPLLLVLIFTSLHLKFNFKNGAAIIKYAFIATAIIMVAFYLYKLITHKIY